MTTRSLAVAVSLCAAACAGGPEKRPLTMTPIESPATPPSSDYSTPTDPTPPPPTGPTPTVAKGPRPKQCERGEKDASAPIGLAVGEIRSLPADLVQYAVDGDSIIDVDASANSLKVTARRSGHAELWYVNAGGDCTVLTFDTSARTLG